MQMRQPMQRCWSMRTRPSGVEKVAPTGQTFTQGGFWQCWQGTGTKRVPSPSSSSSNTSIHCIGSGAR